MKSKILKNDFLKGRYLLAELSAPAGFKNASPGQFLHIRIADTCDPLLRRPMSIHDVSSGRIKILYEAVGKGTQLLSQKKAGSELDLLGPLGHGFNLKQLVTAQKVYIIAGGMGVAPLFFLAKKLVTSHQSPVTRKRKIIVLIGAKTKNLVLCEKEFKTLGCEVQIATEDGSKGFRGRVTELLKDLLGSPVTSHQSPVICACGPKPMLAAVADIAVKARIPAQVSLEEFMGCGLGACLGCVIRTTAGYKRICHDGPVFDSHEIIWGER
jgi:dihydroorotate dehydrogenase electron transfer subunit